MKLLWFNPWVTRIDWCKGHWCGSTYMAMRLSDISSKRVPGKKCIFCVFRPWSVMSSKYGAKLKIFSPLIYETLSIIQCSKTELLKLCKQHLIHLCFLLENWCKTSEIAIHRPPYFLTIKSIWSVTGICKQLVDFSGTLFCTQSTIRKNLSWHRLPASVRSP